MNWPHLLLITGKGGTGKTTLSAALGLAAAHAHLRTLLAEFANDRGLATLFSAPRLSSAPSPLTRHLDAVRLEPRALAEAYFGRTLGVPLLSNRLLRSSTFNALTMAAPGVMEFLALDHLRQWLTPSGLTRRRRYDLIIVDGPATGHALRLLRAPRQIGTVVPAGPIGSAVRELTNLFTDVRRTCVCLITLPDEMAINETVEAHETLRTELALRTTRPVLNRVFPRRFTAHEAATIASWSGTDPRDPLLAAARLQIAARHDAERHLRRLRRCLGAPPISLRHVSDNELSPENLQVIGTQLAHTLFRDAPPDDRD